MSGARLASRFFFCSDALTTQFRSRVPVFGFECRRRNENGRQHLCASVRLAASALQDRSEEHEQYPLAAASDRHALCLPCLPFSVHILVQSALRSYAHSAHLLSWQSRRSSGRRGCSRRSGPARGSRTRRARGTRTRAARDLCATRRRHSTFGSCRSPTCRRSGCGARAPPLPPPLPLIILCI